MLQDSINAVYPESVEVIISARGAMWSIWGVQNLDERVLLKKPDMVLMELQVMNMPIREHLEKRPQIDAYYDVYRKIARKRKLKLIDHYTYWTGILEQGEEEFLKLVPDGIHPGVEAWRLYTVPFIMKELEIRK